MKLAERANAGLHDHVLDSVRRLEPRRQACILDIGCGTGALLQRLRGSGYRNLVGLDITPPATVDGVRFLECDLDACVTPLADGSVDLVLCVEVIEHIENIGTLLAEMARLLAPGGSILMTTPNIHSLEARIRFLLLGRLKQFDALSDPTHVYPLLQFTFERVLRRHGLCVVERWGFPLNGSSPTSRRSLRLLAHLVGIAGVSGAPAGDQLCMLIRHADVSDAPRSGSKRSIVAAAYS